MSSPSRVAHQALLGFAAAGLALAVHAQPVASLVPEPVRADAPTGGGFNPADVVIITDREGPRRMAAQPDGAAAQAPPARNPQRGTLEDPDFIDAIDAVQPLSAVQIEHLRRREEESARAYAERKPPQSSTMTMQVSMRPGGPPHEILLSDDYVTALTLLDVTGAPWPVSLAQAGNQELFGVTVPEKPGNVIVVAPKRKYAVSNLMVLPADSNAPIMLSLRTTREVSYFAANLVIDEAGPLAPEPEFTPSAAPVDSEVARQILDGGGALMAGVRRITVRGDARSSAYVVGDKMYLRTPHTPLFPAWLSRIGARGIWVYEMQPSSMVTLADGNGRDIALSLDDVTVLDAAIAASASSREATGGIR